MKQLSTKSFNWKHIQRLILPLALMILATQPVASQRSTGVYQMPTLSAGDRTWLLIKRMSQPLQ